MYYAIVKKDVPLTVLQMHGKITHTFHRMAHKFSHKSEAVEFVECFNRQCALNGVEPLAILSRKKDV